MDHHHQQQQQQTTKDDDTKSSRRRVSFKHSVRMKLTRHHNDYTDTEFYACYYSTEEYQQFKNDAINTAQMIEMQLPINEFTTSRRGIEGCRTINGQNQRRNNRHQSKLVVFQTQEFQQQCNHEELAQKIAFAYSEVTRSSRVVAHLIGLSDEREVIQKQMKQPIQIQLDPHTHRKRSFEKKGESSIIRVLQRNNSMDSPMKKSSSSSSLSSDSSRWSSSTSATTKDILLSSPNTIMRNTKFSRNSVLELLKYKLDFVDRTSRTSTSSDEGEEEEEEPNNNVNTLFATSTANAQDISQQALDLINKEKKVKM